jgi:hypothetical protein
MFDKVSRLAERAAVGLSRRSFLTHLGRVGLGALAFATFVGKAAADGSRSCIYLGGCCGGASPYYSVLHQRCCFDPKCKQPDAICVSSTCCGGRGSCQNGTMCFSDAFCNIPC